MEIDTHDLCTCTPFSIHSQNGLSGAVNGLLFDVIHYLSVNHKDKLLCNVVRTVLCLLVVVHTYVDLY